MSVVHRVEHVWRGWRVQAFRVLHTSCGRDPGALARGDTFRWPADFDRLAASNGPWINADEALGHTVAVVPLCLPCLASVDVGT